MTSKGNANKKKQPLALAIKHAAAAASSAYNGAHHDVSSAIPLSRKKIQHPLVHITLVASPFALLNATTWTVLLSSELCTLSLQHWFFTWKMRVDRVHRPYSRIDLLTPDAEHVR
eukprot:scaffold3398_cov84-Skeletonema_dohrnii-CCMP3373.AAC.4